MMDLANFGDSVHWGQGHRDKDKFAINVAAARGLQFKMHAHSGARIGAGLACAGSTDPEVPLACPSIIQQVSQYPLDPNAAKLVLVNGGVNDITVQTIITPTTRPEDVRRETRKYCHTDMAVLLKEVLIKFSNAATLIVVTSYFPIFSRKSDFSKIRDFLVGNLIAVPEEPERKAERDGILERVVENAQVFWKESAASLQNAIKDIGSERVRFAYVPYADDNAMFAGKPWLFNVTLSGFELIPEDPVAPQRRMACDAFHSTPWDRRACYIASAGHPNVPGSEEFTKVILAVAS